MCVCGLGVGEVVAAEHVLVLFGALLLAVLDIEIITKVVIAMAFGTMDVLSWRRGCCNDNSKEDDGEGLDGDHFA